MNRLQQKFLSLVVALGLAFSVSSAPAVALTFGQTSMKSGSATYYGKGSWNIDQSNGTRYKVAGSSRKSSAGGNSAYWKASLQASAGFCVTGAGGPHGSVSVSCHLDYHNYSSLEGTRFNSSAWKASTKYKNVQANSKTASAGMQVCEDVRFWFDPCSSTSWTNGIQYRR